MVLKYANAGEEYGGDEQGVFKDEVISDFGLREFVQEVTRVQEDQE